MMKDTVAGKRNGSGMLKRVCVVLMAVLLVGAVPAQAQQLKSLKFGKYGLEKIRLKSMRSGTGQAWVMTENSGKSFYMTDIKGTVYKNGKPFVTGKCDPVKVVAGKSKVVVDGEAQFCDGVTFKDVLKCINFDASDYTFDISMTIFDSESYRKYEKKGIKADKLLGNVLGREGK